mmetsp:Transcript_29669/g.53163  ORF Transcript_29669/g.53163 Transcript_29669/m.53163 type:complete len:333 (+) Transcript_29669:325-1323(+)
MPTVSHDTKTREVWRTFAVSANESTPGRRAESGTKQPRSVMSAFWTQRSATLFSILEAVSPGVSFSTRNALTLPVAVFRAHTTVTSANVPLPIHRFWPSRIHPPSVLVAVVLSALASLPCSGSVSAQHATFRQAFKSGRYLFFCSSLPICAMVDAPRLLWTSKNVLTLASTLASSQSTIPAATGLSPGLPWLAIVSPQRLSAPSFGTSSCGKVAVSQYLATIGATSVSAKRRATSRTRSSSSFNISEDLRTSCAGGGKRWVAVVASGKPSYGPRVPSAAGKCPASTATRLDMFFSDTAFQLVWITSVGWFSFTPRRIQLSALRLVKLAKRGS